MSPNMKFCIVSLLPFLVQLIIALPTANNYLTQELIDGIQQLATIRETSETPEIPANATENGLSGPCRPVTMIFAKGTFENGNVGDGSSPGPAWFAEVRKALGSENVAVQGVPYEAKAEGFLLGGDPVGSENFLKITNDAAVKCPNTTIVIGGYSQGAQLLHNAALAFSPIVSSRIAATVVFGDPLTTQPIAGSLPTNVLNICHDGDIVCKQTGGTAAHLTYSQDAPEAASFVMAKLKSNVNNLAYVHGV